MISYAFDIGTRSIGAVIFQRDTHGHKLLWSGVTVFGTPKRQRALLATAIKARKRRLRRKERLLAIRQWLETKKLLPHHREHALRSQVFSWNPHTLYTQGLKRPLSDHELGRVFYHFAKHRGMSDIQHDACRDFSKQRQRLQKLMETQEALTKTNHYPSPTVEFAEAEEKLLKIKRLKKCARRESNTLLSTSQPLAELAQAAMALANIRVFDRSTNRSTALARQERQYFLGQLMMGKTINQKSIALHINTPISEIIWPHTQPPIIEMPISKLLMKPGHFGRLWCRLSLNQQDHLVTAIFNKDQAKCIQFWPEALTFSPQRLDRILALNLPQRRSNFRPTEARDMIEHVLNDKPLKRQKTKTHQKSKLFEQVFKRLIQKMQKDFYPPDQVIFEVPDRFQKQRSEALRTIVFKAYFDPKKNGLVCPYSGQLITDNMVHSDQVELDHIIPKAYGGSDDPDNLILCLAQTNREKAGRTPYEAFGQDKRWAAMCENIKNWPLAKQNRFKAAKVTPDLRHSVNQHSLDMTTHLSRCAKKCVEHKFPKAIVSPLSSKKVHMLRSALELEKNPNDLRHHTLDAGLVYLLHENQTDCAPQIAQQILKRTKPVFVATTMATTAKSGALARYHNHLDIIAQSGVSKWQMNPNGNDHHSPERRRSKKLIMRVRKGDILHLPHERSGNQYLRIFRLQPSNGTIALGAPYLAGKTGETPLVVKSARQLQKLGAIKCRQMPSDAVRCLWATKYQREGAAAHAKSQSPETDIATQTIPLLADLK